MRFADFVRSLARRRQGRSTGLVVVRRTRSTHLLARRIAEDYSRESLVPPPAEIVAWGQTGGVGRDGRSWSSPAGRGIYVTLLRRLDSKERIQRLPMAIAVTVCETLDRHLGGGHRCRLKWPNDLQVGERKLGGILIDVLSPAVRGDESGGRRSGPRVAAGQGTAGVAVISVGVNVSGETGAFDAPRATSLAAERPADRPSPALDGLLIRLIEAVDAGLAGEGAEPDERLIHRYQGLSLHRPGDEIRCRIDGGSVSGTFVGFDPHGFLRLDVGGEERLISSGVVDG